VSQSDSVTTRATRDLFAAISAYSSHPDYRDTEQDAAALERMRVALADGADWTAPIGPGHRDAAQAAAICADREPLALLLSHGVPLEHHRADYPGMLIHNAAEFGANDVIKMLVDRGIAPDVPDPITLRTPIGVARSWQHGQRAVPLLIELMRAHGCTPAPPRRGDDLRLDRVQMALAEVGADLPPWTRTRLHDAVEGFFVERQGGKCRDFLKQLAEQNDNDLIGAAVAVVNRASDAKPRAKAVKTNRGELIHHGDVEIVGDYEAVTLVVTGNLIVRGLLTNYEGRLVCVGGTLQANAVWSEGPLWVGGGLTAEVAFCCCDNDYGTVVGGALVAPTLLHLNKHSIKAGSIRTDHRFERRDDVPADVAEGIAHALRQPSL